MFGGFTDQFFRDDRFACHVRLLPVGCVVCCCMLYFTVNNNKRNRRSAGRMSAAAAPVFGVPASSWWWKRVSGHLGGRPSGKAPDRRIGRVGPSLEWLQAGKNGQVGQDQVDFMRAGTRIRPPSPGNRAFAGSDSSIVFTFAGRHPARIEAAAVGQRLASGSHELFSQKIDRTERATSDFSGCPRGQGWPRVRKRRGGPPARPFQPF